jgi:ATP phosphoribosyltransferase regulatory subunit
MVAPVTHPIPPGTRDILPDEMRELRRLEASLTAVFERYGYGEVSTPTTEYDEVLALGDERGAPSAHRFFDERGQLLALRPDMTIPIARLVATRFAETEPPFRFFYVARAYRSVRPQRGQTREFLQAGVELIGPEAPQGTAEVVEVLGAALDEIGLGRAVIGIGDADLYRQLLDELGVAGAHRDRILSCLAMHDLADLEVEVAALDLGEEARSTLIELPSMRGGPEVLERARELGGEATKTATSRLAATYEALAGRGVAERVNVDLGLLRDLGYYSGAILEVYDPAVGHVLGGGGRYDELTSRFGRPLPAAGFALYVERLHVAQAEEERLTAGAGADPEVAR